jgi:DNA (cytosine-5)-methyltransferase 1
MKVGNLFNGIGGFALASQWMGWDNLMHCEIDPFCNKVMNHHFPNSYQHEDIRTTDFTIWRGKIDLITGGFPCQPYSTAGKRKGKEDDRHLWPEMLRAIREIQPGWIVGENVRGLTNWNGGLVFDEVQADLETEGYEVLPFLLPAAGVEAPHRRDRIWFIAHANSSAVSLPIQQRGQEKTQDINAGRQGKGRFATNADIKRRSAMGLHQEGIEAARLESFGSSSRFTRNTWQIFPTQFPLCGGNDGLPKRLDGITIRKWKEESLKALGNSVVPQVVYQIFKTIDEYENNIQIL